MFTNSETDCIKKRKLEKLLKKAKLELAEKERSLNEKPPTNKYLDFVEMDVKDKFDARDASFLSSDCPLKVYPVPENVKSTCKLYDQEKFKTEPSIIVGFHNGRLGNQMCSFATIYGLAKMSGGNFRLGLSNDQYLFLSEIFPYFEENAKDHLIEAMYCGHVCNNIKWERYQMNFYNLTYQNIELLAKDIQNSYPTGVGLNLGHYINVPLVYKEYLDELRSKVFVFKEEYSNNAKKLIDIAKEKFGKVPDALIGVHGRFTDYSGHLKLRGANYASKKFYNKAIQYFRDKYKNPMFLVTSDDPGKAKSFILSNQKSYNDVFFVGTIETAIEGEMSKQDSTGTDLALLAMCDHIIISHGTYGMWAAFLASSTNTHIMAHNLSDKKQSKEVMEEIVAVKNANFSNIIFMDNV